MFVFSEREGAGAAAGSHPRDSDGGLELRHHALRNALQAAQSGPCQEIPGGASHLWGPSSSASHQYIQGRLQQVKLSHYYYLELV